MSDRKIANSGIAVPINLLLVIIGKVTAIAKTGVKLGGWGIILLIARMITVYKIIPSIFIIIHIAIKPLLCQALHRTNEVHKRNYFL